MHKTFLVATIITSQGITPNYSKKRFKNAFTVCNVGLDAVVSDMFDKSATSITDYLISSDILNPEYFTSLLQKSLKKKANTVINSIAKLDEKLDKMVAPY